MLKGVNRMVLEVNQPENKYFERMIFFVRPEFSGLSERSLREQARRALSDVSRPPESKKRAGAQRLHSFLRAALAAAAGAGAMAGIEMLIRN